MYLKKMLTAATAGLLAASLIVMPVSAHGHHGGSRTAAAAVTTECPVCTVEDCTEEGHHTHDGKTYCGYEHSGEYCDGSCGSCETTAKSTRSCHSKRHGCH
ncbi:MAG: hypothetical protein NC341_05860 [Blautia sp.]|nr:hypothetical protein [Blautia sp.]MCM1199983.1 hypothetical protein [Bacteroides fragilis]